MYIVIITTIDTIERLQEIKIYDALQTCMARTVLTCLLLYLLLCGQLRAESGPIILPLEIIRFQYRFSYFLFGVNIRFTYCKSSAACNCNNYCWLSIFIEIHGKLRFYFINNGRMSIPWWRLIKGMNKKCLWCLLHVFRSMFIRLVPISPYNMNFGSFCLNIMLSIRAVQSNAYSNLLILTMYVHEFLLLTFIFSIIIWGVEVGMKRTAFKFSFFAAYAIAFPAFPPELPTIVVAPDCFAWRHVWPIPLILNDPDGCRLSNFK